MFDRNKLKLNSLADRTHDDYPRDLSYWLNAPNVFTHSKLRHIAASILDACNNKRATILMFGGHVIRKGLAPVLIDLMNKGYISHLATNGAGCIHDFEMALIGATAESVARYIQDGRFGLWKETGKINDAINNGFQEERGYGEAVGKMIVEEKFPHENISIFAAAYKNNIPITVHLGIGYDITHEHPNCNGAALGATSYQDFLTFTAAIEKLDRGVILNFGTAVMGPEVYLKALAMARNVAHQKGKKINRFTTAVFDLIDIGPDISTEAPKDSPAYYFRPYKTMLVRTVAGEGKSYYIRGNHVDTLPALYKEIIHNAEG